MENYAMIEGKKYILFDQAETVQAEPQAVNPFKRVNSGNKFYHIGHAALKIRSHNDDHIVADDEVYESGNYFSDPAYAEWFANVLKLNALLRRYSYEHGGDKIDWEDANQRKYYWQLVNNVWGLDYMYSVKHPFTIYFISREVALAAKAEYQDLFDKVANAPYPWC